MGIPLVHVDAFTAKPFAGNPAAVCLLAEPRDAAWMQALAREMNLSETAFLLRQADGYSLRWFTPTMEVDLCGHATLASAHVLWELGHLAPEAPARFHTRSGLLTAEQRGEWIEMNFPAEPAEAAATPEGLEAALRARPLYVGKNRFDYLVELESEEIVRALQPDLEQVGRLPARGLMVTARASPAIGGASSRGFDFVSRFFGPQSGVAEDPVTGSAHCCLGPYWKKKLGKEEFVAYQASARGGVVRVRVEGNRVILGGQAVTVFRGELA